jgi:dimethylglycine dehydrogenase
MITSFCWRGKPEEITLTDRTRDFSTLIVTGPEIARSVRSHGNRGRPDLAVAQSVQPATVAGLPCGLARVSFAGELGWEIHAETADIPALYDAVTCRGCETLRNVGAELAAYRKGLPRVEGRSVDRLQPSGGRARAIHPVRQAAGLPGQGRASDRETARGAETFRDAEGRCGRRRCALHVDALARTATWWARRPGAHGATASASPSHWGCCAPISPCAGTELEVEIFGDRRPAIVQPDGPLWDPGNDRLRA